MRGSARSGDEFGTSVLGADLDGDGSTELYVGAPRRGAGDVTVVEFDTTFGVASLYRYSQNTRGLSGRSEAADMFGHRLGAEDANGDGIVDLIFGVPGEQVSQVPSSGMLVSVAGSQGSADFDRGRALHQGSPGIGSVVERLDSFGTALS